MVSPQVVIWAVSDTQCLFFGIVYLVDLLTWSCLLRLFSFELKYVPRLTKYPYSHFIFRTSRYLYTTKLITDVFCCFLLLIAYVFIKEHKLTYQISFQMFSLLASGTLLCINIWFGRLKPKLIEDIEYNSSFVSLQQGQSIQFFHHQLVIGQKKEEPTYRNGNSSRLQVVEETAEENMFQQHNEAEFIRRPTPTFLSDVRETDKPIYSESDIGHLSQEVDSILLKRPGTQVNEPSIMWGMVVDENRSKSDQVEQPTFDAHIESVQVVEWQNVVRQMRSKRLRNSARRHSCTISTQSSRMRISFRRLNVPIENSEPSTKQFTLPPIHKVMVKAHPKLPHPNFPEKKDQAGYLTNKDLRERSAKFEGMLRFWAKENVQNPQLDTFLHPENQSRLQQSMQDKSSISDASSQASSQRSFQSAPDQDVQQENPDRFDLIIKNQQNGDLKRVIQSMMNPYAQEEQKPVEVALIVVEVKPSPPPVNEFSFKITETRITNGGVTYYKINSIFDGKVVATVQRRYNEFKSLHSRLTDEQPLLITLPDQPSAGEDILEFRRQKLVEYLNSIYCVPGVKQHDLFKEFLGI